MIIEIDKKSGFCNGVKRAIQKAEEMLSLKQPVYCLGEIVHNEAEIERLRELGLITVNYEEFQQLKNVTVLFRAHGEPPETYKIAKNNHIELIDATCVVVKKLQKRVFEAAQLMKPAGGQIVIFGKKNHAEVVGLLGNSLSTGIAINSIEDLVALNLSKPITTFSQTTQSEHDYLQLTNEIQKKIQEVNKNSEIPFVRYNTICQQVAGRETELKKFAANHDVIIFVSGKKSSNGLMLFNMCKSVNEKSFLISSENEIVAQLFVNVKSVGICGAASTPQWLMKKVAKKIQYIFDF